MAKQFELIPRHGGVRANAGRKRKNGKLKSETTKVIRVPLEIAKIQNKVGLENLLVLIHTWKDKSLNASPTSPRWDKLRTFLLELEELGIL